MRHSVIFTYKHCLNCLRQPLAVYSLNKDGSSCPTLTSRLVNTSTSTAQAMRVEILQSTLLEGMLGSLRVKGWPAPDKSMCEQRVWVLGCAAFLLWTACCNSQIVCVCVYVQQAASGAGAPTSPLFHSMQWHHCLSLWMLACTCTELFFYLYAKSFPLSFCFLGPKTIYVVKVWNTLSTSYFCQFIPSSVW